MRYLIISYDFLPKNSPSTFRLGSIARYLSSEGHNVDIITKGSGEPGEYVSGVTVYPAKEYLLGTIKSIYLKNKTYLDQESCNSGKSLKLHYMLRKYFLIMSEMIYSAWNKIYWPDCAAMWIPAALSLSKRLMKNNQYDAIITVSLPFSNHMVGLKIKKQFPNLYWLADIDSPFSITSAKQTNNYKLYEAYNRRAEQDVFNLANVVSVRNNATKQEFSPWLPPENFDKIKVIPPLFIPNKIIPMVQKSKDKLRLLYCGSINEYNHNPSFLLQIFKEISTLTFHNKQIELHFMGNNNANKYLAPYSHLIGKQIFLHGYKSKDEIQSMMAKSDVLINICSGTTYQLPNKVVEYAASIKPVINFSKLKINASVKFFEEYGNSLNISQTEEFDKAIEKITMFLKLPINNLSTIQTEFFLKPYSEKAVCKQYLDALPNHKEVNKHAA